MVHLDRVLKQKCINVDVALNLSTFCSEELAIIPNFVPKLVVYQFPPASQLSLIISTAIKREGRRLTCASYETSESSQLHLFKLLLLRHNNTLGGK